MSAYSQMFLLSEIDSEKHLTLRQWQTENYKEKKTREECLLGTFIAMIATITTRNNRIVDSIATISSNFRQGELDN